MFITSYGSFNGTTWENMFQIILKRKYMQAGYQRVPATPGDFGIEGFTKDGLTFQCFCPETNEDNKKLYERQRDKITADINKLKINETELVNLLGGTKLTTWTLITPKMGHHDLIPHCNTKRDLVKSWNLPFIDGDFKVLVHECDDYALEIGEYFNQTDKKLSLQPDADETSENKLVAWKDTQIPLVENAISKNEIIIRSLNKKKDADKAVNILTNEQARHYLNGESILRKWRSSQPENHQRFTELMASVASELQEKCLLTNVDPSPFLEEIKSYMEDKIRTSFPYLDESTVVRLKNYCIAFWIMTCPIYFEESTDEITNN